MSGGVCRVVCVAFMLSVCAPSGLTFGQTDHDRLQDFLDRLGLLDLQTADLEQRLEGLPVGEDRTQLARRLADLYAQQLTESLTDSERYSELGQRVQRLLQNVPEAKTAALDIMLLQVDYQRAESLIRQWLGESDQQTALQEAQAILKRITPLLQGQYAQLTKLVDEQLAVVDKGGSNVELAERELLRRQAIAARAAYFTGWSLYYRGLLAGASNRTDFQEAHGLFRQLLELTAEDKYADFDAPSLALESPWRARALVGLGMSEAALGNVAASLECFRILNSDGVAAEVRDQADYWCIQALLLGGHHKAALEVAHQRVAELKGDATEGKVSFCVALVRGGNSDPNLRRNDTGRQLTNLGVRGLSQLRQYRVLHQLLTKYGIHVDKPKGFLLLWLQGQQRLDQAQASKNVEDFQLAAESLRAALSDPEAASDVAATSRCREQLAWCFYNMKRYADAVSEYRKAAKGLKEAGDAGAVEAAWMSFVAASKLADEDRGATTEMNEIANWLNQTFPGHEHAKRAKFLVGRIQMRGASPEERLKSLQNISRDDPNFSSARQEICALFYEKWRAASDELKTVAAKQLQQAIAETLSPDLLPRIDPADQLALRLMAIDVALNSSPSDQAAAAKQLSAAGGLIKGAGVSPETVAEYRYRAMQIAPDSSEEHVSWFLEHGKGSKFETAALISAAKTLDSRGAEQTTEQSNTLGMHVYGRLTEILGSEPEKLVANRNAQVALSRLAHYAYQLGERKVAAAALVKLLAAFPKDRGYLRRAGLVHFELKQFQTALEQWRTIVAGSRAGTEPWYEAKYYQIACLLEVDRDAAASVFEQLKFLYPNFGPPTWRERFLGLEKRL